MRPPMGAGSVHQANQKGNSMGLLMPMYTFGIVAFFVYTIMKVRASNDRREFEIQRNLHCLQLIFSWWWENPKAIVHIRHRKKMAISSRKCFGATIISLIWVCIYKFDWRNNNQILNFTHISRPLNDWTEWKQHDTSELICIKCFTPNWLAV